MESDRNDGEVLMQTLKNCCSCGSNGHTGPCSVAGHGSNSVPNVLSTIKGPWAIIYWQVITAIGLVLFCFDRD